MIAYKEIEGKSWLFYLMIIQGQTMAILFNDCIQGDRGQIMAILFNDHTKANHGYSI